MVRNGVTDYEIEVFSVIVFLVADLSFVKEVLGKYSCTQSFGCFHCQLSNKLWDTKQPQKGIPQSIEKMQLRGLKALELVGNTPNKGSTIYKKMIAENDGQCPYC